MDAGTGAVLLFFTPICTVFFLWHGWEHLSSLGGNNGQSRQGSIGSTPAKVRALDLTSPTSVRHCLGFWAELGTLLFYVFLCERAPPTMHGNRFGNTGLFWILFCVFMIFSLCNIVKNKGGAEKPDTALLNREQTEEWKGWMQYLFLAYHYFHEASVYNGVRCFISCYVWLTGFGNFSFFYLKRDFGVVRFLQMIWRLNFLVFWLCLLLGNTFILYYINPLHTFYFLLTFAIMRLAESKNASQHAVRAKLFACGVATFVVWEYPAVFEFVFGFLGEAPTLGAKSGVLHEWHFRTGLDHWSALFGMVFALNYPAAQAWLNHMEGMGRSQMPISDCADRMESESMMEGNAIEEGSAESKKNMSGENVRTHYKASKISSNSVTPKLVLLAPLLISTAVWGSTVFQLPKREYNALHPYFFLLPLLCYIVCRNFTPLLRRYHSSTLAFMGKITLETYLMQHHIWLANNAKAVFVVVPGYPIINLMITTATFVYVSLRLFRVTVGLRAFHVPGEHGPKGAIIGVSAVTIAVSGAYVLSRTMISSAGYWSTASAFFSVAFFGLVPLLTACLFAMSKIGKWEDQPIASEMPENRSVVSSHLQQQQQNPHSRVARAAYILLVLSVAVQLSSWLIYAENRDDTVSKLARATLVPTAPATTNSSLKPIHMSSPSSIQASLSPKDKYSGISRSPGLGAFVLLLLGLMLKFYDVYAGLGRLAFWWQKDGEENDTFALMIERAYDAVAEKLPPRAVIW